MKPSSSSWNKLEKLIIVTCHAIYVGGDRSCADHDEYWVIRDSQKGEPPFYIEHIQFGVGLAASSPNTLLVFSGGQTRVEAGPRSEAQGYWLLADQFAWWQNSKVRDRATTEEFARDSYENMLFGIARFRECSGHYPSSIDIVGWEFKRERFDFHRQTIRWPEANQCYRYHGVNNPCNLMASQNGEARTAISFRTDPFGLRKEVRNKRAERNPFHRQDPYAVSCPELVPLLDRKATEEARFNFQLPWRIHRTTQKE